MGRPLRPLFSVDLYVGIEKKLYRPWTHSDNRCQMRDARCEIPPSRRYSILDPRSAHSPNLRVAATDGRGRERGVSGAGLWAVPWRWCVATVVSCQEFCPQMTQITQIHTKNNICVNLRDLRGNELIALASRALTSGLAYQLEASSIEHRFTPAVVRKPECPSNTGPAPAYEYRACPRRCRRSLGSSSDA